MRRTITLEALFHQGVYNGKSSLCCSSVFISSSILWLEQGVHSCIKFWQTDGHNTCCPLPGGEEEMHRAHREAVEAIFVKKEKSHHHLQLYTSRKTGKAKWAGLEMWGVKVSLLSLCLMLLPAQHIL